jgi:hypothetical protein
MRKKIRLDLHALEVETFLPDAKTQPAEGSVHGHLSGETCMTDGADPLCACEDQLTRPTHPSQCG